MCFMPLPGVAESSDLLQILYYSWRALSGYMPLWENMVLLRDICPCDWMLYSGHAWRSEERALLHETSVGLMFWS